MGLDAVHLGLELAFEAGPDVRFQDQADARRALPAASTARFTTSMTSSHSPSMFVNMAFGKCHEEVLNSKALKKRIPRSAR